MTNFTRRTLTGTGLVVIIVTTIWFGPYSFTALMLLINVLSLYEFYSLSETSAEKPSKTGGALLSVCLVLCCPIVLTGLADWRWLLLIIPVAFGIFLTALFRPMKRPFSGLALTFMGVTCISVPVCFFVALPFIPQPAGTYHFEVPLGIFLLLWTNDTVAYLFGSRFGKHPLFHRISPKKTWEGSVGGAAATLGMAYILSRYFKLFGAVEWEIFSLVIVASGTCGDLIKSLLKRSVGVKDSGTILPGHGGMLDRFDSLLGSAPFALIYLILLER